MLHTELRRIVSRAPSRPFKIFMPMVAVALCFCAVCGYLLIEARRAATERSGDAAASLATAIEADVVRNIETLSLSLNAVIANLKLPEIEKLTPELRQRVLFERTADARRMGAILVLDETGYLKFDSRNSAPEPQDLSSRDYFKVHKNGKASVLYVGRPQFARDTGQFFVGISRRLLHADGSFAGVASGTMQIDHVQPLFKDSHSARKAASRCRAPTARFS